MSTSSSQPRIKDGSAEYDPSVRGDLTSMTSVMGDGISMTDMDSANLPHRLNISHSTSSHPATNGTGLPGAPHAPISNTNNNHSSHHRSSQKAKQNRNSDVTSDDEGEDIFKPSNDNFFAVKVPSSSIFGTAIDTRPLSPDLENSLDASTDTIVIPTSENLTNNDQRTFKLLRRSPAIPVSSEERSSDDYDNGGAAFNISNGARSSGDSMSHAASADLHASYNQSYSSIESSEGRFVTSSEHKPDIPVFLH